MRRLAIRIFFLLVACILVSPLAVVAGVSINEQRSLTFPPRGFSLSWYAEIFADAGWRDALVASLVVAGGSAALASCVAFPLAWFLWRRKAPWARVVQVLGMAPFILPPVITALGFLSFWITLGAYGAPWTVVVGHGIFFVTLPLVTLTMGFNGIDPALVEAAATMGADERTILRTVVLPLILPYAVSGFAFAFVLSLNEYIVAYMAVGFTLETLPIKIFNALRYGYTPTMAAVSLLFVAVAGLVFGLIGRFGDLPKLLGAWSGRD
ncbi:MAG TPA: ABC transporter permease [Arenibaculum sp.]|nr:ABC transporter permease [Arenibaculum sp.]